MGDCNVAVVDGSKMNLRVEPRVTTGAICMVGAEDGAREGLTTGDLVVPDGMEASAGSMDGDRVGSNVGSNVGSVLGSKVGSIVGTLLWDTVIDTMGDMEGMYVWDAVGRTVGMVEGGASRPAVGDKLISLREGLILGASVIGTAVPTTTIGLELGTVSDSVGDSDGAIVDDIDRILLGTALEMVVVLDVGDSDDTYVDLTLYGASDCIDIDGALEGISEGMNMIGSSDGVPKYEYVTLPSV